jgi:hypothetical protein
MKTRKSRKQRLELFRLSDLTRGQGPMLARLLVYFNRERDFARELYNSLQDPGDQQRFRHSIPLSKIYKAFRIGSRDRKVLHYAAAIFFIRTHRGNSHTKKSSGWKIRETPTVNERLLRLLATFYSTNADYFTQVRKVVMTSTKDNKTEVTITTQFEVASDQTSELLTILQLLQQHERVEKETA